MNLNLTMLIQLINCVISVVVIRHLVAMPALARILSRIKEKTRIINEINSLDAETILIKEKIVSLNQSIFNQTKTIVGAATKELSLQTLKGWSTQTYVQMPKSEKASNSHDTKATAKQIVDLIQESQSNKRVDK